MEAVPLLAHKEEEAFKVVSFGSSEGTCIERGKENHTYQEIQLLGMGQSALRGNQIHDSAHQDWSMPSSTIKCKFNALNIFTYVYSSVVTIKVIMFIYLD